MDAAELSRLEQFVDKLLVKFNELKKKYIKLEATLAEQEDKSLKLEQDLAELKSERVDVGSRVAGLINRIERWEAEEGGQNSVSYEEKTTGIQGSLFSRDSDAG